MEHKSPLGSFHRENGTTFSGIPEIPVEQAKKSCSIYIPTGISEFFGNRTVVIATGCLSEKGL